MQFAIGAYSGEQRTVIKEYQTKAGTSSLYEIAGEHIPEHKLHLLVVRSEDYEHFGTIIEKEQLSYPVIEGSIDLEQLNQEEALQFLKREMGKWVLKNNLSTLEQQVALWEQLQELIPSDFGLFCEELWTLLNRNLCSTYLRLIFPDVEEGENERSKKKLVYRYLEGQRKHQEIVLGGEAEARLMEAYGPLMQQNIQIIEWFPQKGEFLAVVNLRGVRMIIMAHMLQLDPLQNAWLKLFFDGLQQQR